ncbi:MAG TPA: TIGR00730 family Rossman fold protein [Candidatus Angelobacter sp.]|nr:TIGR00730 family Rossman fold protein [Candidatus Angelobacter sp.]
MASIASVCVYCGSSLGANPRHAEAARQLGAELAGHGIRLVYGGGRIGLMGQVADAVLAGGGQVIGVIPEHLQVLEKGHHGVTELRVVASMHERKNLMFELSDAFVILPGGFGTLDEAFEMLTWRQLQLHDKPILFLNIDDYWTPFAKLVDQVIGEGFARESSRRLFAIASAVEDVIPTLLRLPAPAIPDSVQRL